MTTEHWLDVIRQAGDLGVETVIFIGGEATLHPEIEGLLRAAADAVACVELYTNLVRLTPSQLRTCQEYGIDIATSFYSNDKVVHDSITVIPSHDRVKRNLQRVLAAGLSARVGIVDVVDGQDVDATARELRSLGVSRVGVDRNRGVGRGACVSGEERRPLADELCGQCSRPFAAVLPSGDVVPCVFARDLPVGNVMTTPLQEILTSGRMAATRDLLDRAFRLREHASTPAAEGEACDPAPCAPEVPCSGPICPPSEPPGCHPVEPCKPADCFPHGCRPKLCRPSAG
jgi:MoaA/NifB/PqqE/SkfB family radical SAM enzyme